jgi:mono/diheme cytochrome c family protein
MQKNFLYALIGLLLGVTAFFAQSASGDEYAQGKHLFDDKCATCHGKDGEGNGPAGAYLNPSPPDFTKPGFWQQNNIDQVITDAIENGHGPMPAFNLNAREIKAIIDYLSHTFKPGGK